MQIRFGPLTDPKHFQLYFRSGFQEIHAKGLKRFERLLVIHDPLLSFELDNQLQLRVEHRFFVNSLAKPSASAPIFASILPAVPGISLAPRASQRAVSIASYSGYPTALRGIRAGFIIMVTMISASASEVPLAIKTLHGSSRDLFEVV